MTAKRKTGKAVASKAVAELAGQMTAAVANLPAVMDESEPRAFPIMDEVPPGHALFRVDDETHEPHLHDGEWVVVDTNDREIVWGELYLVLQSSGPILWQIIREKRPDSVHPYPWSGGPPFAWMSPLSKPSFLPNGDIDIRGPIHLSDGPISASTLQRDILGHVVGILDPRERFDRQQREICLKRAEWERSAAARRKPPQIEGGAS